MGNTNNNSEPQPHGRPRKSTFSKIGKILGVVHDNDKDNSTAAVKDSKETTPVERISPKFTRASSISSNSGSSRSESRHTTPTASPSVTPVLRGTLPSRQSSLRLPKDSSINKSVSHLQLSALGNEPNGNGHDIKQSPLLPRFKMLEGGNHEHHLRSSKRQEKLSSMLKGLLGAKKLRNESISAVPNILQSVVPEINQLTNTDGKPPTLLSGLLNQVQKGEITAFSSHGQLNQPITAKSVHILEQADSKSFVEKYGTCQEVVGRGTFGVVRVSHKKLNGEKKERLHAVKEFKRKPQESDSKYSKRLTSEFCIASSLQHINIIHTLDLLQDAKGDYCEVMEYCSGGDLYSLIITAGKLEYLEADCFFKQLIRGMEYMHQMGVAHRDLKPENLLITSEGNLKITDFGNAECFRMAWEDEIQLSSGVCGSSPYIAPEEFVEEEFDPRPVDVWACGLIYMAMRTGRQMWKIANSDDEFYATYVEKRKETKGYEPLELIKRARCRNVIYSILDPVASRRITGAQVLNSEWVREIKVCDAGEHGGEVLG